MGLGSIIYSGIDIHMVVYRIDLVITAIRYNMNVFMNLLELIDLNVDIQVM